MSDDSVQNHIDQLDQLLQNIKNHIDELNSMRVLHPSMTSFLEQTINNTIKKYDEIKKMKADLILLNVKLTKMIEELDDE